MTSLFLSIDTTPGTPAAGNAERLGFDGVGVAELAHDPMITLASAAKDTMHARLAAAALVAFGRSPMTVAMQAADVHALSGGRLALGLGSQIKPHIEARFGMPWSAPAARMRDFVGALRAIWHSFATGDRLNYRGTHYRHTLLPPQFNPGGMPHGEPPVWLAGVGPKMTELVGEVADGYLSHPIMSARYLEEVTLPLLDAGRRRGDRESPLEVVVLPLVAVGVTDEERATAAEAVRRQLAFYGSTPAYRAVLELHGRGDLADALSARSRRGDWDGMTALFPDEALHELAAVGTPEEVVAQLTSRFGTHADAFILQLPYTASNDALQGLVQAARRPGL